MSTEIPAKKIPRHIVAGIGCAFLAAMLTILAAVYYLLVGVGVLATPTAGVPAMLAAAIVVSAMVPIGLWCAHVAIRPILQRIEQESRVQAEQFTRLEKTITAALDQVSDEALTAVRNAGKWEGFTAGIRETGAGDTSEVLRLPRRSG